MKKFLSLAFCICFIFLAGCGSDLFGKNDSSSNSQSSTPDTTPSVESTPSEQSVVEVVSEVEPETFDIKLSFVGDVMLASFKNQTTKGSFNEYAEKNTPDYFFKKVQSVFAKDDFTIVNLENVFTDKNLKEIEKGYTPAFWFRSKTDNVKILTSGSVEGVSIANNHTGDYGAKGYADTNKTVEEAGLNYGNHEKIMYYEKNGFKIAVICYGLWSTNELNGALAKLAEAEQKSDYQIIYFHGGKERIYKPEDWKIEACHQLVDAGADLVVGNHPHVLQPREIYNGVEIVYSLGNFCFGGNKKPGRNTVIYQMKLTIQADSLTLKDSNSVFYPCYVFTGEWNNYQPCLITDKAEKKKVLDFMNGKTDSPY